jgi:hypothetical protein
MSETFLIIGGIYNLLFATFHFLFWKIFDWENDLASLTSVNRAIMQVINLCLTFVFVIFGVLSLLYPSQMVGTELGRILTSMIAVFWFLRAIEQVIFFKLKNWISWAFLFIFLIGAGSYSVILL